MPQIVVRIPEDLAEWLEETYPARGDISRLVRDLLTERQLQDAAKPLIDVEGGSRLAVEEGSGVKPSGGTKTPSAPPKRIRGRKLVEPTADEQRKWADRSSPLRGGRACAHKETAFKFGKPFCLDCGEFV